VGSAGQGGSLLRLAIDTWKVTTLAGGDATFSLQTPLAADATSFYFIATSNPSSAAGAIYRLSRAGGAPTKLADIADATGARNIAVDATRVYWMDLGAPMGSGMGSVHAVPIGGGADSVLATNQAIFGALAVDASSVYWAVASSDPTLADIVAMPVAGGAPATLATGQPAPTMFVADGGFLYWMTAGSQQVDCTPTDGALLRIPVAGGAPATLAKNIAGASAFTVAGGEIAFTQLGAFCNGPSGPVGAVARVPVTGGAPVTLAPAVSDPGSVIVDGSKVYFTTSNFQDGSGAIQEASN
jgi:hypothetical protein